MLLLNNFHEKGATIFLDVLSFRCTDIFDLCKIQFQYKSNEKIYTIT